MAKPFAVMESRGTLRPIDSDEKPTQYVLCQLDKDRPVDYYDAPASDEGDPEVPPPKSNHA